LGQPLGDDPVWK